MNASQTVRGILRIYLRICSNSFFLGYWSRPGKITVDLSKVESRAVHTASLSVPTLAYFSTGWPTFEPNFALFQWPLPSCSSLKRPHDPETRGSSLVQWDLLGPFVPPLLSTQSGWLWSGPFWLWDILTITAASTSLSVLFHIYLTNSGTPLLLQINDRHS